LKIDIQTRNKIKLRKAVIKAICQRKSTSEKSISQATQAMSPKRWKSSDKQLEKLTASSSINQVALSMTPIAL